VSQRRARARARGREPDIVDLVIAVEPHRKDRHHEEVDDDRDCEADAALDRVVEDRLALRARVRDVDLARLHERGVQEDVVRHHKRADDADRDLQLARAARTRRPRQLGNMRARCDDVLQQQAPCCEAHARPCRTVRHADGGEALHGQAASPGMRRICLIIDSKGEAAPDARQRDAEEHVAGGALRAHVHDAERHGHRGHERCEERLELAHAKALEVEQEERVDARDENARPERRRAIREQLDRDRRPDDLLDVAADDRDLGHEPERDAGNHRVHLAAVLCEVLVRDDAEAHREQLHEEAEEGGPEDDPPELEARLRASLEVGLEVAGVDVRDRH
jgi:hypothetical protein